MSSILDSRGFLILSGKHQLSDNKKGDVARALTFFKEGDPVRARILSVDLEKRRVNFGLKPSYFLNDQAADSDQDDEAAQSNGDDDSDAEANDDDGKEADVDDDVDMDGPNASDAAVSEDEDSRKADDVNELFFYSSLVIFIDPPVVV
jgi:rRNA biogenesis protein RRP5